MGREIKQIFANMPKPGKNSSTVNNEENVKKNKAKKHKVKKSKTKLIAESYLGDPKIETEAVPPVENFFEGPQKIPKLQAKKPKFMAGSKSIDSNFESTPTSSAAHMAGLPKNKPIEDKLTEAKLRKLKVDNEAVGKVTKAKNKLKSKAVKLEKAEMKDLITFDLIAAAPEEQPRALKYKNNKSKLNAKSESVLGDPKIKANLTSSVADILEESQKTLCKIHKLLRENNKIKTESESIDSNFKTSSSAANVKGLPKNKPLEDEAKLRKLKFGNEAVVKITKSKNKLKSKAVGLETAEMKDLITTDLIAAASEEQPRTTKLKDKKAKNKVKAESESILGDPNIKAEPTSSVPDILEESQKTHKVKKSKTKLIAESYLGDPKIETEAVPPVENFFEGPQKIPKLQAKKPKFMAGSKSIDSNFESTPTSSAAHMAGLPKNKPIEDKLTEAKLRKLKVDNEAVGKVTKAKNKLKSKAVKLEKAEMKDLITFDLIAAAPEEQPRALKYKNNKSKLNAKSESVLGDPKIKANQTSSVSNIWEESASAESDIMEESLPKSEPHELSVAKKAKNKDKSAAASDVNKKIETGNKASPPTSNGPAGDLVTIIYSCKVCKSKFRSRYMLVSSEIY